ncbi:MAG TPA: M56 family metallopeptidase [Gemmatimonadaceae bacterium]|nr:M56 family metallopeptidase [Gemmatimonadaceae bacterium]
MLCILYVNVVGACLGIVGLLAERALPANALRRWIWLAIIPATMILPGMYRTHHAWSLIPALEQHQSMGAPLAHAGPGAPAVLDPDWWARTRSSDVIINRYWSIASWILIALAVANAWRVWRIVRLSRRPTIIDGVRVIVTDAVGPATVGLMRSRVLVPRWVLALPAKQREYVLRHEEEHRRSHDGLVLFIASLPLILIPWNLALWWILRRLCLAVEMDCDKRVVGALGDPHAYGELLLRVAEAGSRGPRLQPAFLGMGMLEHRLTQLVAPTRLRHLQKIFVPCLIVALLTLVVWMPHPILGHTTRARSTMGAVAVATGRSVR